MKVLISERQLRRLIREFYENEYIDIIPNITDDIIDNVFVKSKEIDTSMEGVKKILEDRLGEYFSIKNDQRKYNRLKKLIVENFEIGSDNLRFCGIIIAAYRIEHNDNWNRGMPDSYVFKTDSIGLKKAVVKFFDILKNEFPKEWEEVQKKIEVSDIELTPFKHAGDLSKEKGVDDLKQRIYDWEYTKDILGRLLLKYIHKEEFVNEDAFKFITKHNIIENMIDEMDEFMSKSDYTKFSMIDRNNINKGLTKFIDEYKKYFNFGDDLKHSPYKVFLDLVIGIKDKTKFEFKK